MLSVNEIKSLDIEISSYCVASCPMCPRNFFGMKHNAGYHVTNITLENFTRTFDQEFVGNLSDVRFNGNFGDFNMNPEAIDIVEYLRKNNKDMYIEINTNGFSRDSEFYKRLANSDPVVYFALDGLEDTHHLHRIGTKFERVVQNAQTYIGAGGRAIWKMIVFDHNKHQIPECRQRSEDMNFHDFELIWSGRSNAYVFNADGSHSHTIGQPPLGNKPVDAYELLKWKANFNWESGENAEAYEDSQWRAMDKINLENIVEKKIDCEALGNKRIFMSSTGDIFPCCYLGFNPAEYNDDLYHGNRQLKELMTNVQNNAVKHGLEKAVAWFSLIEESWQKQSVQQGRLHRCELHCGKC